MGSPQLEKFKFAESLDAINPKNQNFSNYSDSSSHISSNRSTLSPYESSHQITSLLLPNENNAPCNPLLIDLVLRNIAERIEWKDLKSLRIVSSQWLEAYKYNFYKSAKIVANFSPEKSTLDFINQFSKGQEISNVQLNPGDSLMCPVLIDWVSYWGYAITDLTLGSCSNDSVIYFDLNPLNIKSLFEEWCPNIKNLTLINAKITSTQIMDAKFQSDQMTPLSLSHLTIITKRAAMEFNLETRLCKSPFTIAEYIFLFVQSVHTLRYEFHENFYSENLACTASTNTKRVFATVKDLSIFVKSEITENVSNLIIGEEAEFPNLKRLSIVNTGATIVNASDIIGMIRFPELDELDFSVSIFSAKLLDEVPKLKRLKLQFYKYRCVLYYDHNPLLLARRCPQLHYLEYVRNTEILPAYVPQLKLDNFAHPNVKQVKIDFNLIKNAENIAHLFPRLEILDVNLTGKYFARYFRNLLFISRLRELTVLENSSDEEFQYIIKLHFPAFLTMLQKLHLKTKNNSEVRGANFMQTLQESVDNTASISMTSLTFEGFQVNRNQLSDANNNLPFKFLVL